MASLNGITNEHEFYSQHFLNEQLASTLSERVKAENAKEAESKSEEEAAAARGVKHTRYLSPWSRLEGVAREVLRDIKEAEPLTGAARIAAEREAIGVLMGALGLPMALEDRELENGVRLPLLGERLSLTGEPYLWILHASREGGIEPTEADAEGAASTATDETDPLELCISPLQLTENWATTQKVAQLSRRNWLTQLIAGVFRETHAPRWVILAGLTQWVLIDRAKFGQRRVMRFSWPEILARREAAVLQATALLVGSEAFEQIEGQCYLERIDENSHRHAHGVSTDLKYALRESIELLGNEAARQLREKAREGKEGFFSGDKRLREDELSDECLRYMYRLLFLFFIESRPELKYVPIEDEAYLSGYSLESLRDLELIPLVGEAERNGTYLHQSIDRLFRFFEEGTPAGTITNTMATASAFTIERLPSSLFDAKKLPLLKEVQFPNWVLQRVIELMSLSRPARGKRGARRGRISYAHLGLNQLGAVYEALLSYRGFFADETLYEVKKADVAEVDPLEAAYFVPESEIDRYSDDEKVFVEDPVTGLKTLKKYEKGAFIYRMAGSARENSASYYTPEVLTKCLVKEALDVLVKQQLDELPDDKARAEKILTWRICEPAMGSAAFLNEGVNQVAELYMKYAMKVPGAKLLTQDEYREELQKVKMFLADRNIFGVDLNPVAVELAEVSLWLNALSNDHYVPWFGLQLHSGNSLFGARRQCVDSEELLKKKGKGRVAIEEVGAKPLPAGGIWHFLLPNADMANYTNKEVAALEPEKMAALKVWRKEFTKPLQEGELSKLVFLSAMVEDGWQRWAAELAKLNDQTTDCYDIYGRKDTPKTNLTYEQKMALMDEARYGDGSASSGYFARLKLVMDYWCALWAWPITEVYKLPTRTEYLDQLFAIMAGVDVSAQNVQHTDLFTKVEAEQAESDEQSLGISERWERRVRDLAARFPAIGVVAKLAKTHRFMHWPLRFADVFMPQDGSTPGFDLTLGNPPWMVASWDSAGVMADADPWYRIREKDYSTKGIQDVVLGKRDNEGGAFFERHPAAYKNWLEAYCATAGSQNFFNSEDTYPELVGSAADLFKLFLPTVWRNAAPNGVQGLLHPETVYTETKGVSLRKEVYKRVRKHYQFENKTKLFADVDDHMKFSINIYGSGCDEGSFVNINNLYFTKTIDLCNIANAAPVEGRLDANGRWNAAGHPDRKIIYTSKKLALVARIFDGNPAAPQLPSLHAKELLEILEKFGSIATRLGDQHITISSGWHESGAKLDGTIQEQQGNATVFPIKGEDVILNGPHIFVGSPLFKVPLNPCNSNNDWTCLDLTDISDDYLPRIKYLPNVDRDEYLRRMPKVEWDKDEKRPDGSVKQGTPIDAFYRVALRSLVPTDGERTLTAGILSPCISHVHIVESLAFKDPKHILTVGGYFASLPLDFFVRQQNKTNLLPSLLESIPLPDFGPWETALRTRALCLNALTTYYADLWKDQFTEDMRSERWTVELPALNRDFFHELTPAWCRSNALRTDLERRQALVEIDVLVALALGLTLAELQTCYRLDFRKLQATEDGTYYDQKGRILFTSSFALDGVGLPRKARKPAEGEIFAINGSVRLNGVGFEDVRDMESGEVSWTYMDDTLPGGPRQRTIRYQAPFFKMNREEDYARAWRVFSAMGEKAAD